MDPESYEIKVLYHLTPHLMWIEKVCETVNDDALCFEQIGLFGIMPLCVGSNYETDEILVTEKSKDWTPASQKLIDMVFSAAKKVYFQPCLLDYRSSIFDTNVHKFGEIYLIFENDNRKSLTRILQKKKLAYECKMDFYFHLHNGDIDTKLKQFEQQTVIENIYRAVRGNKKRAFREKTHIKSECIKNMDKIQKKLSRNERLNVNQISKIIKNKQRDHDSCSEPEIQFGRGDKFCTEKNEIKSPTINGGINRTVPCGKNIEKGLFIENWIKAIDSIDEEVVVNSDLNVNKEKRVMSNEVLEPSVDEFMNQYKKLNTKIKTKTTPRIPNYNEKTEELYVVLPAGANINSGKIEVRPKAISKVKSYLNSSQKNEKPSDDIWKGIDSEISYNPGKSDGERLQQIDGTIKKLEDISSVRVNGVSSYPKSHMDEVRRKKYEYLENGKVKLNRGTHLDSSTGALKYEFLKKLVKSKSSVDRSTDTSNSDHSQVVEDRSIECAVKSLANSKFNSFSKMESKNKSNPNSNFTHISTDDSLKSMRSAYSTSISTNNVSSSNVTSKSKYSSNNICEFDLGMSTTSSEISFPLKASFDTSLHANRIESELNLNKNLHNYMDESMSKFIEKIVTPKFLVHSKNIHKIKSALRLQDVYFTKYVLSTLVNMSIKEPMALQSVVWPGILRGYSVFMVGPMNKGKTMSHIPAVCSLISDRSPFEDLPDSHGPLCIIVCCTSKALTDISRKCTKLMGPNGKVLTCHAGLSDIMMVGNLLGGCDILVTTPGCLCRLLSLNRQFALDLSRLSYIVFDDCERLNDHFGEEFKKIYRKVKRVIDNRLNKSLGVKFIVASRVWCGIMNALAKTVPNSLICIAAHEECVVYSGSPVIVKFLKEDLKLSETDKFLQTIDKTENIVIICGSDDEVNDVKKLFDNTQYYVLSGYSEMSIESIYALSNSWKNSTDPLIGTVLICLDTHLEFVNVKNATYLIHYSLPETFSTFCRRFGILIDNFKSIYSDESSNVKVVIYIDQSNIFQLPKLMNFIKRCNSDVPKFIDSRVEEVLHEKDKIKANNYVPLCDSMLSFGDCTDFWHCRQRHSIFQVYDQPAPWFPRNGWVKIKILHFHSIVHYSARLLSNIVDGKEIPFPQTNISITLKLNTFYADESNKVSLGTCNPGDMCAIEMRANYFARCRIVKVLQFDSLSKPVNVLVNLIDEERLEIVENCTLLHLPDDFKEIPSYVALVRLGGLQPKDKDLSFSDYSKEKLIQLLNGNENLYLRAKIVCTVSNSLITDKLEACMNLKRLGETVVLHDIKEFLTENGHAQENPIYLDKLKSLIEVLQETQVRQDTKKLFENDYGKSLPVPQWAHLPPDDYTLVYFSSADDPDRFYLRLEKFQTCLEDMTVEIQNYIKSLNVVNSCNYKLEDIVLAKFPDDSLFYRARLDRWSSSDKTKVLCYFVDHGDWRTVSVSDIRPINGDLIKKLPFQAIECRLIGLKPIGDSWSQMSTNYFCDLCFQGATNDLKQIYVKYYTKSKAELTGGNKYSVVMIDTTNDDDSIINMMLVEKNLASFHPDEAKYLDDVTFVTPNDNNSDDENWNDDNYQTLQNVFENKKSSFITDEELINKFDIGMDETDLLDFGLNFLNRPNEKTHVKVEELDFASNKNTSLRELHEKKYKDKESPFTNQTERKTREPETIKLSNKDNTASDLDSDDLSSPESSISFKISETYSKCSNLTTQNCKIDSFPLHNGIEDRSLSLGLSKIDINNLGKANNCLQQSRVTKTDDCRKPEANGMKNIAMNVRRPKINWKQTKEIVIVKINGTGITDYELNVGDNTLQFKCVLNEVNYAFNIDLYGVVNINESRHEAKGLYILVNLKKRLQISWPTLTKDQKEKSWIVYDLEMLDCESDKESMIYVKQKKEMQMFVKNCMNEESDSSADEIADDLDYW